MDSITTMNRKRYIRALRNFPQARQICGEAVRIDEAGNVGCCGIGVAYLEFFDGDVESIAADSTQAYHHIISELGLDFRDVDFITNSNDVRSLTFAQIADALIKRWKLEDVE